MLRMEWTVAIPIPMPLVSLSGVRIRVIYSKGTADCSYAEDGMDCGNSNSNFNAIGKWGTNQGKLLKGIADMLRMKWTVVIPIRWMRLMPLVSEHWEILLLFLPVLQYMYF